MVARRIAALALAALGATACVRGSPLRVPNPVELGRQAPDTFRVAFETSRGRFVVAVHRDWAPRGADRLYYLASRGFYNDARFFRVVPGFVAQFGLKGDTTVDRVWETLTIPDDTVKQSNRRGFVTFASGGPNSRTTQLFINLRDNVPLDAMGFPPVGQVVEGMEVVDSLYAGYGEGAPEGRGPDQSRILAQGNGYLARDFPRLDVIKRTRVMK